MKYLRRFLLFSFLFLLLTSLFVASTAPTVVRAVDTPSIPQFSMKLVDNSYDVAPTTSTHPYTGETTTIQGYRQNRLSAIITIKNQPFKPSAIEKEEGYMLFYIVQHKGHFEETWSTSNGLFQSNSGYTTSEYPHLGQYDVGSQLDFRVRAIVGKPGWWMHYVYYEDDSGPYFYVDVVCSDWSSVQTVVVEYGGSSAVSPSNTLSIGPSDTSSSDLGTLPGSDSPLQSPWPTFLLILIVIVCFVTLPVAILAYHHGQRKTKSHSNNPPNSQFIEGCEVQR